MNLPKLEDLMIEGKRVIVRGDLDVGEELEEGDDIKLKTLVSTLDFIVEKNCRVVLTGHRGRPEGKSDDGRLSLFPVCKRLSELMGREIKFYSQVVGGEAGRMVEQLQNREILMLENLRFDLREEGNDEGFASALSNLADVYINEAFSASGKNHASIVGIPKVMKGKGKSLAVGIRFEKEIENLSRVLENSEHPVVVIIGGAKTESKLPVIEGLYDKADIFLLGGVVANTFLSAEEKHPKKLGKSIVDYDLLSETRRILGLQEGKKIDFPGVGQIYKIKLPTNLIIAEKKDSNYFGVEEVEVSGKSGEVFNQNKMVLDIGPETVKLYGKTISQAKTVVLVGPMGVFEEERFGEGTEGVLRVVVNSGAFKVAGGGDTQQAIEKFRLTDKFDWISVGGGATLEFLAKGTLPGIEALL